MLFRHNLPQPTQAQLMRGEFPETPCIEQGVVLSCRFAEWKVRRAPRVLRMAVVSQSSVKFGKKRVFLVGTINFMTNTAEVATSKFVSFIQCGQFLSTLFHSCAVACKSVQSPSNGFVTFSGGTAFSSAAFVHCEAGFEVHPEKNRIVYCGCNGTWSAKLPVCNRTFSGIQCVDFE